MNEPPRPLPFEDAERLVRAEVAPLPPEDVDLRDAYGRVLASSLAAPHDLPPFPNSAVDGWAVRAEDVASATDAAPVHLEIVGEVAAGRTASRGMGRGEAMRIMTGAPMPEGADSLVMQEHTSWTETRVTLRRSAEPGRHLRRIGDDVRKGQEILSAGSSLHPAAVGMLASLGVARVGVHRRPLVAVLATGDELLEVHEPLRPGMIRSSNDWTLVGQLRAAGAADRRLDIARDDLEQLGARIESVRDADVLVTSGGVSVGDRDLLGVALERAGFRTIFWRVASSPGKPLLFGRLGSTLVFGLPGNPVSSMVAFENFVRPALRIMQGDRSPERPRVRARVLEAIRGPEDRRHFARVRLRQDGGQWTVREVGPLGSGNLQSMVEANALAILPEGRARAEAGELIEVMLLEAALFA